MHDPKDGWSFEDAVRMLADGYGPHRVQDRTGFDVRHLSWELAEHGAPALPDT